MRESVNVLPRLADRPNYRCRFSAEIELKRERVREGEGEGGVSELFGEVKKDFSRKSGSTREWLCTKVHAARTRSTTVK